jgi:hypothetical protein
MSMLSWPRRAFLPVVSLVSSVVIGAPRTADAQSLESIGIRAQGMGGAYVAVADDATATWWNPAGLATGAYFSALVEYDKPRAPQGASIKGLALGFPALGLSYYRLPLNQMRFAGSTGGDADSREQQGDLSVYGVTVGQSLGDHLVLGSTLKLVRAGQSHGDLDMGAMARFGAARMGIVVKNIRKPSFDTDAGPLELKRQARAGAAFIGRTPGLINELALAVDADVTKVETRAGDERHVAGGFEVVVLGKKLGLRVGAAANTVGERRPSYSGGASVILVAGGYIGTYLDAQVTGGSDEARKGWGLGLRMTF